jgi:8-oxo-dGTP pyrophosphatase MutT (NUDIX family)
MLDLKIDREGAEPKDATTLILLRDSDEGVQIFCVERNKKSRFLGGAVVFPGGKVDAADGDAAWAEHTTAFGASLPPIARDAEQLRALGVAACRETLEEAAILPLDGEPLGNDDVIALRDRVRGGASFFGEVKALGRKLALSELVPFARWVTPTAEPRRYDARFFACKAPRGQKGAHDDHETTTSFWATPKSILDRFVKREIALAPPTHRTVEIILGLDGADKVLAYARTANLGPVCPALKMQKDAKGETLALVLPGDPEHDVKEQRVPGKARYVLRDEIWVPEDPPVPRESA